MEVESDPSVDEGLAAAVVIDFDAGVVEGAEGSAEAQALADVSGNDAEGHPEEGERVQPVLLRPVNRFGAAVVGVQDLFSRGGLPPALSDTPTTRLNLPTPHRRVHSQLLQKRTYSRSSKRSTS